jgi:hypothetical protein
VNWRIFAAVVVAALIVLGGGAVAMFVWGFDAIYSPEQPAAHYAKPHNLAEAQRDDLDYLRLFLTWDWSYTATTRAEASALIDKAQAGPLPMPHAAFELLVSRVVALADNGHTNIWSSPRANRLNRLPVRFTYLADGLFVTRALPQAAGTLGKKVVAVNGHAFERVRRAIDQYTGGTLEERDMRLPFFVEAPQLLQAAGFGGAGDRETLTLEDARGDRTDVTLKALPPDSKATGLWPIAQLQPRPVPKTDPAWQPALRGVADDMLLFADPGRLFFMRALPAQHAYYVRFNSNRGTDKEPISEFTAKVEAALLDAKPHAVIIDMRLNGGGDYTMTAAFMRSLPQKLADTRFYVLEGSDTFSAGMTSAAFLKQAGGARTVFVGSWPGDRIRFNAEGNDFCLPFSGICMSFRTAIHDYSTTQCRPIRECFALNWFYPVAIKTFKPDIFAPLTFAALSKGHDPALQAIFPNAGF